MSAAATTPLIESCSERGYSVVADLFSQQELERWHGRFEASVEGEAPRLGGGLPYRLVRGRAYESGILGRGQ